MKLLVKIAAKVNLGLDILNRREDNYHDIRTVMHSINIFDYLIFEKADKITITCDNPLVPLDNTNIVHKCIEEISKYAGLENGFLNVHIEKKIPVCAGLGGGSSNGAAALIAYNELYELGLSKNQLAEIGKNVGADIPFLIHSGIAFCEGIGDEIIPLKPDIPLYLVLCKPDFGVSTKFAYDTIDLCGAKKHPDFEDLMYGLINSDSKTLKNGLINVFEPYIKDEYPEVKNIINKFNELNALGVQMSGSGPSVFGLYPTLADAQKAFMSLSKDYSDVYLTSFCTKYSALTVSY